MSVLQADEDELYLSVEALDALKDFSMQRNLDVGADDTFFRKNLQDALDTVERDHTFNFEFPNLDDKSSSAVITLQGINPELGQTLESTGLTVWTASKCLATYVWENQIQLQNKSIIELGAGLGLCGILCTKLKSVKKVTLTDGGDEFTDDALQLLKDQVQHNVTDYDCHCSVERLTWGKHDEFIGNNIDGFDVILAADVIYESASVIPLLDTVTVLLTLKHDSVFLLGYTYRNVSFDFVRQQLELRNLAWEDVSLAADCACCIYKIKLANNV